MGKNKAFCSPGTQNVCHVIKVYAISRLECNQIGISQLQLGSNKYNAFFQLTKSLAQLFLILDNLSVSSWVKKAKTGYQFVNVLSRRA